MTGIITGRNFEEGPLAAKDLTRVVALTVRVDRGVVLTGALVAHRPYILVCVEVGIRRRLDSPQTQYGHGGAVGKKERA